VRILPAILLLALLALFGTAAEPNAFPLWDGQETVEQYARRAKLEPTQTLDSELRTRLCAVAVSRVAASDCGPQRELWESGSRSGSQAPSGETGKISWPG
jgi:hypothetical protein